MLMSVQTWHTIEALLYINILNINVIIICILDNNKFKRNHNWNNLSVI